MPCSKTCRVTSKSVGKLAGKALNDKRSSKEKKTLAATALAQRSKCK